MNTEFVDMTMVGRIEDPDGEVLVVGAPDRRKMADLHPMICKTELNMARVRT